MADSRDDRRAKVHTLPLNKRPKNARPLAARFPDADQEAADPLLDALHRLADDILDEPVPDRLRDALRKNTPEKD